RSHLRPPLLCSPLLPVPPSPHPALRSFPTRRSSDLPSKIVSHKYSNWLPLNLSVSESYFSSSQTKSSMRRMREKFHFICLDGWLDRKSTRLNSSHVSISYAVFCLTKKRRESEMRLAH